MTNNKTLTFKIHRGADVVGTQTFPVGPVDVVKIGRLKSSHLCLDDDAVARMHAVIEMAGDELRIVDLGTVAGTVLNGTKIFRNATINQGDALTFGSFRVELLDVREPVPVVAQGTPPAPIDDTPTPTPTERQLPNAHETLRAVAKMLADLRNESVDRTVARISCISAMIDRCNLAAMGVAYKGDPSPRDVHSVTGIDPDTARCRLSAVAGIRYYDHGDHRRACLAAWGEVDGGGMESLMADAATFDEAVVALYEICLAHSAIWTGEGHRPGRRYVFDCRAEKWKPTKDTTDDHSFAAAVAIGRRWLADSSLKEWFPITAEMLDGLERRAAAMPPERLVRLRDKANRGAGPITDALIDEMIASHDRLTASIAGLAPLGAAARSALRPKTEPTPSTLDEWKQRWLDEVGLAVEEPPAPVTRTDGLAISECAAMHEKTGLFDLFATERGAKRLDDVLGNGAEGLLRHLGVEGCLDAAGPDGKYVVLGEDGDEVGPRCGSPDQALKCAAVWELKRLRGQVAEYEKVRQALRTLILGGSDE